MAKPLLKKRAGNISITVWENTRKFNGKEVEVLSAQIEKRYQDRQGKWVGTNSFPVNQLYKVELLIREVTRELTLSPESTTDEKETIPFQGE